MRAKLFHRTYPDKFITPGSLQTLYSRCNIKRKVVRFGKPLTDEFKLEFPKKQAELKVILDSAIKTGKKIIFLDEVVFTSKTLLMRVYSNKGCNITIDRDKLNHAYWSVIAAISMDNKVEHLYFEAGAINMVLFNEFLFELRKKMGNDKVFLFMDQLRVHYGSKVMPTYPELNFEPIWNVKYSTDFNPIETVFA